MSAKSKKAKAEHPAQASNADRRGIRPPKWLVAVIVVALVAIASFAAFEFLLPGAVPQELVGQWRVAEGPLQGMTLEFKRTGAMTSRAVIDGKEWEIEGTAVVQGNTLHTTTENPYTGKRETGAQVIVTLTETELVTQDAKGTKIVMRRVR